MNLHTYVASRKACLHQLSMLLYAHESSHYKNSHPHEAAYACSLTEDLPTPAFNMLLYAHLSTESIIPLLVRSHTNLEDEIFLSFFLSFSLSLSLARSLARSPCLSLANSFSWLSSLCFDMLVRSTETLLRDLRGIP